MKLYDYLISSTHTRQALDAYTHFAEKNRGWSVPHKFELYAHSVQAWNTSNPIDFQFKSFENIYKNLKSYWQIARGGRLDSAECIFNSLILYAEQVGIHSNLRIVDISDCEIDQIIVKVISSMRFIKKTKTSWGSTMAISKILHFFNPCIFPIYDNAVIEQQVLKSFREEWRLFEPTMTLTDIPIHFGSLYYLKYVLWCAHLMEPVNDSVMPIFTNWVSSYLDKSRVPLLSRDTIFTLSSTAFEMISIGASTIETSSK